MTTKLSEPKFNNWKTQDGWVFGDYASDPRNFRDPREPGKILDQFKPVNSFETQQGILGQYRHFYGLKNRNHFIRSCYQMCVTKENVVISNLTQDDKICARECLISAEKFEGSNTFFLEKQQSRYENRENTVSLDNYNYSL
jgi:hypothetical protein